MPADDGSQLAALWDAAASTIFNVYDAYGWIVPALVLSLLFLALIALFGYLLDDIPVEFLDGFVGVFRWTRKRWRDR